ncbi:MAG: hypothetical protein GY898_32795 [Proteobacteria bacterium]|nr:hypothetical protein [Pseudomonadota bacterium]
MAVDLAVDFLALARELGDAVVAQLKAHASPGGVRLVGGTDLKGKHGIDGRISAAILAVMERSGAAARVVIEGEGEVFAGGDAFTVILDPIDGSTNCDRWVGDPGFALAITEVGPGATFGDLGFGYVRGLVSGDEYWTADGGALYRSAFHDREFRCDARANAPERLAEAAAYLNLGYGPTLGGRAAVAAERFVAAVADVRGFDTASTEVGHIARGAAHLRVECRKGSEGANLLASMTILRAAGGVTLTLEGADVADLPLAVDAQIDFVSASNEALARQALALLAD